MKFYEKFVNNSTKDSIFNIHLHLKMYICGRIFETILGTITLSILNFIDFLMVSVLEINKEPGTSNCLKLNLDFAITSK